MKFNREYVRSIVEKNNEILRSIARDGGNINQKSLDQQDELKELTKDWSKEEQTAFYELYDEELEAITAHIIKQTIDIENQTTNQLLQNEIEHQNMSIIITIGIVVIVAIVMIAIISK